nr:nucleic acid-binding, OB-fold protein [Tanacetum cinerariifolium]
MVYSYLSISSPDSYCDTTDYSIHDENLGSTISEYEEKLMDELDRGQDVSILKHVATHKCTNEVPHALDTSTNDFSVNDPNKGKSIVDEEPIVVETYLNNFTHDESLSLPELASDVNKDGAGDPDWIVDYLINHLCTEWVVLQIKIDKYNIAPTYVRRYITAKYYGHDVNDINKYIGISSSLESIQKIVCSDLSISSPDVNDANKHIGISSSSRSVRNMVYSDLSISSPDSYWDTTDYAIDDENLGSTISEYEEKLMGLSGVKTVNNPNKGNSIVDAEPVIVETHLNDFTHDESSSLPELVSDVKKDVPPLSSPTIEPDEMRTHGDEDKMMISVDEAAINQHVDIMQDY